MASDTLSKVKQLIPQFLIMMVIYFVAVTALRQVGVEGFYPEVAVALVIAFGYPALLRYFDRAPPVWQYDRPE
ncbi:hypothetical protein BRD15_05300 [Halobacteriales archaeon SW_6_65_15]|jgi:hypothetical protein|nr:MAG: hypothetical protein BRD15_05300 [Halobacteriales archaeon SW_6_65_15]